MVAGKAIAGHQDPILMRLSKRIIDAAAPAPKDHFLWDQAVKGFGAKITPAGAKIYVLQYRCKGRQRRYTIGRHGSPWTVDEARTEAVRLLGEVVRGSDPADLKRGDRADVSFSVFADRYLREHADLHKKPRSAELDRWLLRTHILPAIGSRRLADISRSDIARLHRNLAGTPIAANRVLGLVAAMFALAERWGLRQEGSNPCRNIEKFKERSRERFLSEVEIARLGEALGQAEAAGAPPAAIAAIRLLILSGARKGEILGLEWRWVSFERSLLELPDSKTGSKAIYLNAPAMAVLADLPRIDGNPHVLPGDRAGSHIINIEKTWRRVRHAAELDDVRLHDLRHSFASVGLTAGFSLPLIGALLGHAEVATTQRYAHLGNDPVRQANETIGSRIAAALGVPPVRVAS
jgi:integrase